MTETKEPKVTECWAKLNQDGSPNVDWTIWMVDPKNKNYVRVVAVKAEDYDAMRRELEELRKELKEIKEWGERHGMRINGGV